MTQLMRGDDFETRFYNVWLSLWNQTMADLQAYYDLAYESSTLGAFLFDNDLAQIARALSRDLFIKTYWQLFKEQEKNGTYDAHMYLLYAIFGGDATIYVENPNPLHVIYHIATKTQTLANWVTLAGDNVVTRDGSYIVFRTLVLELNNEEIASILKATSNYGEYLEFDITQDVSDNDYGHVNDLALWYEDYGSVTQRPDVYADYGLITEPAKG